MLTWTAPCARHRTTQRSPLHGDDSQQHQPTHTTMASSSRQRAPSWRHLPHGSRRVLSLPAITAKEKRSSIKNDVRELREKYVPYYLPPWPYILAAEATLKHWMLLRGGCFLPNETGCVSTSQSLVSPNRKSADGGKPVIKRWWWSNLKSSPCRSYTTR